MTKTKQYASSREVAQFMGRLLWACITVGAWLTVAQVVITYLGWPALLAGGVIAINYVRRGSER